ncbi:MAG TPA: carboxypeptidase-like regulatory domain-containing protein, partial [Acidimicrobiia bacterium]
FQVEGDKARVEVSLGEVWFPLSFIERVVANEVELTSEEKLLPAVDLGFGLAEGADGVAPLSTESNSNITGRGDIEPDPSRSIAGKVLTESGQPVAGVELTASALRLFQPGEGSEKGEEAAQTATGGEGSYRFEQLPRGEYKIHSAATDRYAAAQTVVRTGVDFANLVLPEKRRLWVYGSVSDSEGEPLANVQVVSRGRPDEMVATDYAGRYVLEMSVAGRGRDYELRFSRDGYRRQALSLPASRVVGRDEVRLDARMEPVHSLATVAGRVRSSDGAPVSGETVLLLGSAPGSTSHHALTDEAGEFLIPEVVADTAYRLSIRPRAPYRDHLERVRVGVEGLDLNVVLEPLGYGTVSGQMMDVLGDPVPHFSLWLQSTDESAQQLLVTGDAFGRYAVDGVPSGPLRFATLANPRFTISGPALSPWRTEETIDLILDQGGREVRGRIVDGEGIPVAASQVALYWAYHRAGLQSRSVRHAAVAADGSFRFNQLGPGVHTLTIHAPGFQSAQIDVESPADLVVQLRSHGQGEAPRGNETAIPAPSR